MSSLLLNSRCNYFTDQKKFGLCDDPPTSGKNHTPAYLDNNDGTKWIAVVVNEKRFPVKFTAIDNCIPIFSDNHKMAKRCDGVLTYNDVILFVELKQRNDKGANWVDDGIKQLKSTILHFQKSEDLTSYSTRKAYISNKCKPLFKESQIHKMQDFLTETGYILRVESRITL